MFNGFLGTHANFLVDLIVVLFTLLPFLMFLSFKLARNKQYSYHIVIHSVLLLVVTVAVIALEVNLRFYSLQDIIFYSPYYGSLILNIVFIIHVSIAVITYILWVFLFFKSYKSYNISLPGSFSKTHKRCGVLVFIGILLTLITSLILYWMLFIY